MNFINNSLYTFYPTKEVIDSSVLGFVEQIEKKHIFALSLLYKN